VLGVGAPNPFIFSRKRAAKALQAIE